MASPQYAGAAFQKWQLGIESVFGTAVAATYNPLVQGDPTLEDPWEDIPHDPGQFESLVLPVRVRGNNADIPWTGGAFFQTLPFWFKGLIRGGVSPTGAGANKTWTFTINQTAQDRDSYTAEHVGNLYTWRAKAVYLRDMTLSFDESGSFYNMTVNGRGQSFGSNTATGSITPNPAPSPLLGARTKLFLNDAAASIGTTQITGALRRGEISIGFEGIDEKVMDGDGFDYDALGYGQSIVTYSFTFEQKASTMTEAQYALSTSSVPTKRFGRLQVLGNIIPATSAQEELRMDLPGTWRSFGFDRIGQNVVWTLGGQVKYDSTLGYGLRAIVVNDQASY